ncbi:uncharacterized protein LOC129302710 [Prosopis cineraria]|uniref:uncharacterized protein LOC129302710 n=1 Tax=Prosopis cineraria TaxID=364024 RepID=UPI002410B3B7|nr:uncharacterized protein LOC129302710 [Prosopis cineraria]
MQRITEPIIACACPSPSFILMYYQHYRLHPMAGYANSILRSSGLIWIFVSRIILPAKKWLMEYLFSDKAGEFTKFMYATDNLSDVITAQRSKGPSALAILPVARVTILVALYDGVMKNATEHPGME